ncbi:MAG: hypothetical protein ABJH04_21390 [Cyclobacteriaceae bacterium]
MDSVTSRNILFGLLAFALTTCVNGQDAEEIFQRGNSLWWEGKYQEALMYVDSSLKIDSSLYQRYLFRAKLNAELGMFESAIEDVTKCIERCKCSTRKYHLSTYYLERARLQVQTNDHDAAISDATKSINSNPHNWQSYNFRSDLFIKSGNLDGALSDLTNSIKIDDNQAETFIARGQLRIEMGDIDGACSDLSKVVSWGLDEFESWINENCSRK